MIRAILIVAVLALATVFAVASTIIIGGYVEHGRVLSRGVYVAISVGCAILVCLFALLGESFIEDTVKAAIICLLGFVLWHYRVPKLLCLSAFCGSTAAVAANQTIRFFNRKLKRESTTSGSN